MRLRPSDHFNGKTFFQSHHEGAARYRDLLRWKLKARPKPWPATVSVPMPPPLREPHGSECAITWIGHATFLIQTPHGNILTDPVFSPRVSPVRWVGPRRVHPPGVPFDALPRVDAVLLSHDHYDHCDTATLRRVAAAHDPVFIAPLRHRDLLAAAGASKIVELDWWESTQPRVGLEVTLTPSKHWSNRFGTRRNHRLWGGFFLNVDSAPLDGGNRAHEGADAVGEPATSPASCRLWFAGDTGYDMNLFAEIRNRLGAPDVAMVPIGAYEPRWFMAPMHINPAEAVQVHHDIGARQSLAMHWGTFQLTDEAREEPVLALDQARRQAGIGSTEFRVMDPGESVLVPASVASLPACAAEPKPVST